MPRMMDISNNRTPRMKKSTDLNKFTVFYSDLNLKPEQVEAFNFYKKNSMSIEILKEDHLQKINFRVKNKVCTAQLVTCITMLYILHSSFFAANKYHDFA